MSKYGELEIRSENFLHVQDLSEAIIFILKNINAENIYGERVSTINIGTGEEISIKKFSASDEKSLVTKGI